jgi:uncharacterized protein YdaT
MSEQIGVISIPTDEEGFVLLQCPLCGELFKLRTEDIKREDVIEIWCPCCGLKSESYFTKDVLDLALKKAENYATDRIYEELKQLERKSRHSLVTIKAGKKPTHREEYPVRSGIENMKITHYICCNRDAKTKAMYKMCGSYCPFCGVRYDEY